MKKRLLSMFLGVTIFVTSSIVCFAMPTDEVENNASEHFIVVNIPNDFEWDYDWRTTVKARYKETKGSRRGFSSSAAIFFVVKHRILWYNVPRRR